MKRCPQCEFVYENEQGLCDMDGSELVFAPTSSLTLRPNLALPQPSPPAKLRRKSMSVLSLSLVVCGTIFTWSYFVFTHKPTPQRIAPSTVTVTPRPQPTSEQSPPTPSLTTDTEAAQPPVPEVTQTPAANVKATKRAQSLIRPAPKLTPAPAPRQAAQLPKPASGDQKKESTVVSLLKKTGRALKKPFKF
jgi:cytoskeletal protein RodZ